MAAAALPSDQAGDARDAQGPAPVTGGQDGQQASAIPAAPNKTPRLSQRGSWPLSELRKQSARQQRAAVEALRVSWTSTHRFCTSLVFFGCSRVGIVQKDGHRVQETNPSSVQSPPRWLPYNHTEIP